MPITGVTVIGDHSLRLLFEDGTVGDVSFRDEPWTGVFEPLGDPARFAKVKVEGGTIVRPKDSLDMTQSRSTKPLANICSRKRHALTNLRQRASRPSRGPNPNRQIAKSWVLQPEVPGRPQMSEGVRGARA